MAKKQTFADNEEASQQIETARIAGYVAVRLPASNIDSKLSNLIDDEESSRWIYLRSHSPETLFIANLPQNIDAKCLRKCFLSASFQENDVEIFAMPPGSGQFARVRLGDSAVVDGILDRPAKNLSLQPLKRFDTAQPHFNPVDDWIKEYMNSRDLGRVEKWSRATMATYENQERRAQKMKLREARDAAEPDEDGFVVVRRGATATDRASGASMSAFSARRTKDEIISKRKRKESSDKGFAHDGFYRWQRQQTRKNTVDSIRKKFENDKKRIALIRELSNDQSSS